MIASDIRAAVFDGPGKPFRFESLPRPPLGPGEAIARVRLCTICGSDLHTTAGRRHGPTPCVLGHEAIGVVEERNGAVRDVDGQPIVVGDRVVWSVAASCGTCFFCGKGLTQKCERLRKYGHERLASGTGPLGGLATHCHLISGTALVRLPDGLPDEVAAPAGCATATVAEAFRRVGTGGTRSGECVVILGLGMLGLTACAMAASEGASSVIACDVDAARLSLAARFGATHAVRLPAGWDELQGLSRGLTAGRGADVVLELSGSSAVAERSVEALRIGGTAVWVGAVSPVEPARINPEAVVRRCLTISGVHNYSGTALSSAVRFLARHHTRYPFGELVAGTFPLDEVDGAFRFAGAERPVRVAVACQ